MIKTIFIAIMILIGLMDFGFAVMCSHMEDREQYKHMKGGRNETIMEKGNSNTD